jgi:hypothetical protein
MTELLKKAFEEASKLPPKEQDAFAALLLAELESDRAWDESFAKSSHELAILAREAREDLKAGRTEILNPDEL